ncbi:MAG TPA: zinc metalloprotease HtpX, partial [Candidatus Moranbacteria bacterium]|nr:zinc metalloprotease HtpX [Candidatus Moranbacteria bacterium]
VGIVISLLAPLAAMLIQLAVSRKREFLADAAGAMLTRYPEGLASALEKISADATPLREAHGATAHLFIANPFKNNALSRLFATHPDPRERIRRLREMDLRE